MIGEAVASAFYGLVAAFVGLVVAGALLSLVPALEPLEWLAALAAGGVTFVYTFTDAIDAGRRR